MEILEKAWNDFLKYYDKKARKYMKEKEIENRIKDAKSKEIKVFHSKSSTKSP